jgi:hypothetical protein
VAGADILTSWVVPAIKVHVVEIFSMTPFHPILGDGVTTAIVRMLGKAVKFRHCPATVSAPWFDHPATEFCCWEPGEVPVIERGNQPDSSREIAEES